MDELSLIMIGVFTFGQLCGILISWVVWGRRTENEKE